MSDNQTEMTGKVTVAQLTQRRMASLLKCQAPDAASLLLQAASRVYPRIFLSSLVIPLPLSFSDNKGSIHHPEVRFCRLCIDKEPASLVINVAGIQDSLKNIIGCFLRAQLLVCSQSRLLGSPFDDEYKIVG